MNITHIKNINNQSKIIFLTSNNSTPTKIKRISFSNSLTANKNKIKVHNKSKINKFEDSINNKNFSYNVYNDNQKYIFSCYKISPIIALLIYEKSINKLLEFIKKRLPKNNFIEIKKKYISFVIEELNIKSKNILHNISEPDLINLNVKLFTSNNNNNNTSTNCYSGNFNKLIYNPKPQYKPSCNSNSLFQLNKNRIKRGKLLSYNSFNTDLKRQNNSLVNSSNILFHPKKSKNIFHTEYNQKINNNSNRNSITNLKQKKDKINHFKNISMSNGNLLIKNNFFENNKKYKLKEKIINKDNEIAKIFKKMPSNKRKNINNSKNASSSIESKKLKNEDDSDNIEVNIINNNNNNELNKIKDYEKKKSLQQLNLIKENLEDNLKNMLNFSYGYYLNYEKESESSKSQNDFIKIQ
jgi:hypothetical protein